MATKMYFWFLKVLAVVSYCAQWTNPQTDDLWKQWSFILLPYIFVIIYPAPLLWCGQGSKGAGCVSSMRYQLQWVSGVQMDLTVHSRAGRWELSFSQGDFGFFHCPQHGGWVKRRVTLRDRVRWQSCWFFNSLLLTADLMELEPFITWMLLTREYVINTFLESVTINITIQSYLSL